MFSTWQPGSCPTPHVVALTRGCFCPHLRHTADTELGWGGDLILYCELEIQRYGLVASVNINKSFTHDLMEQQIRGLGTRTRLENIQIPTIHPTPEPLLQNYLRFCRRANTRKGYFEL